jgi:hypothetical protein
MKSWRRGINPFDYLKELFTRLLMAKTTEIWPERNLAGNAIDFHVQVLGLSFHDAMRQITGP